MNHSRGGKELRTISEPSTGPDLTGSVDELVALAARQRAGLLRGWCRQPISSAHLNVLLALEAGGPLSMSRLAEDLALGLPNATGIVTRMEEHGLVRRSGDAADRRRVLVTLTDRGRQLIEEHEFMRRAHLVRVLQAMPAGHPEELIRSFRSFLDTADRLRDCGQLPDDDLPSPITTTDQGVPLR